MYQCMYFCDYHFSTIFRIRVLSNILFDASTFSGIFLVLNQSMSVKIIFIYSNENDGFNIKIIIFWSKKPQQIWRRKRLTSVCFRISKRFQQNSTLQKTTGGGKDLHGYKKWSKNSGFTNVILLILFCTIKILPATQFGIWHLYSKWNRNDLSHKLLYA